MAIHRTIGRDERLPTILVIINDNTFVYVYVCILLNGIVVLVLLTRSQTLLYNERI